MESRLSKGTSHGGRRWSGKTLCRLIEAAGSSEEVFPEVHPDPLLSHTRAELAVWSVCPTEDCSLAPRLPVRGVVRRLGARPAQVNVMKKALGEIF